MPTDMNATSTTTPCTRCNGTGRYDRPNRWATRRCFTCSGNGRVTVDAAQSFGWIDGTAINSRGDTVQVSVPVANAAPRASDRNWHDFATRYPAEAAWLQSPASGDFGASLIKGCRRYGGIPAPAPIVIQADNVRRAMDAAASGPRKVRLVLGAVTFKLSGPRWSNGAGMILCYESGSYAGWIDRQNGFHKATHRTVTDDMLQAFRLAASDPQAAAQTYGQDTGRCACCRRLLTDPVSVMSSIGPVCAERFGWGRMIRTASA